MDSTQTSQSDKGSAFQDEQGGWSAARILLALWLSQAAAYIWLRQPVGIVLTLDATVATGLIAWAGGARIAQYVGPQIGAAGTAVGQAIRDAVAKRRDPKEGLESTP